MTLVPAGNLGEMLFMEKTDGSHILVRICDNPANGLRRSSGDEKRLVLIHQSRMRPQRDAAVGKINEQPDQALLMSGQHPMYLLPLSISLV
jgi:hypothetical protein